MPSSINVSDLENVCNGNPPEVCCFCGSVHIWKHGHYIRTGFYWLTEQNLPPGKSIQRYLCQSPACKRSFSELPDNILPYCRFFFDDFLVLYEKKLKGTSAYSIWKTCHLFEVSINAIRRLLCLFKRVLLFVQNLYRELRGDVTEELKGMSLPLIKENTWFGFNYRWYHAIYPARLWEIQNPHNLDLQTR